MFGSVCMQKQPSFRVNFSDILDQISIIPKVDKTKKNVKKILPKTAML